ncbi:MAG: hypothetical protein M1114_04090 [Candidatus Dependentiae bacterium]|nr:hypothetical protein [Candidatus Dependentiae bacterium]
MKMNIFKNLLIGIAAIGVVSIQPSEPGNAHCLSVSKEQFLKNLERRIEHNDHLSFLNTMAMKPQFDAVSLQTLRDLSVKKQVELERKMEDLCDPSDRCTRVKTGVKLTSFVVGAIACPASFIGLLVTQNLVYIAPLLVGLGACSFPAMSFSVKQKNIAVQEDEIAAQKKIQGEIDGRLAQLGVDTISNEESDANIPLLGSDENV